MLAALFRRAKEWGKGSRKRLRKHFSLLVEAGSMPWVFSAREAADALGVHVQTLYVWLSLGELPAKKVRGKWLIPKANLIRWLQEHPAPRAGDLHGGD